jgi:hypothetical protein
MKTITFTPTPEVSDNLKKLSEISTINMENLINVLLASPLRQIVEEGDSGLLRCVLQSNRYPEKATVEALITVYEEYIAKLKSEGCSCFHSLARPMRTRDGFWKVSFKSTHPFDEGKARFE